MRQPPWRWTVLFLFLCGPGQSEVIPAQIDHRGNLIIRNKAVFPVELYSVRTEEDFAIAQAQGFNAVIEFGDGIEELAAKHGMILTDPNWFHRDHPDFQALEEVRKHGPKPALFAYNLNDEPDLRSESGCSPADLKRFARILKKWDPERLISVTCSGGAGGVRLWKEYAALVDIFRIDPYPVVGGAPIAKISERVAQAMEAAGPHKPVWLVLQAWSLGPGTPFPSDREDRCMTYLGILGGAKGISHFDFNVDVWSQFPDFWNGLILNNRELRFLSTVILESQPETVWSSAPQVRARAWRWEKSYLAIVANEGGQPAETILNFIELAPRPTQLRILFQERQATRTAALLSDEQSQHTGYNSPKLNDGSSITGGHVGQPSRGARRPFHNSEREAIEVKLRGYQMCQNPSSRRWSATMELKLEPYEVKVFQFLLSRSARPLDPYPLSEADVSGPGVAVIERWGRDWIRLKNVMEQPATASVYWPRRKPEVLELDLAFRPMRRVACERVGKRLAFSLKPQTAYEVGDRPRQFDVSGEAAAFEGLDLDLELQSPYPAAGGFSVPAQRFRAFQSALLPISLRWASPRGVNPAAVRAEVVEPAWNARLVREQHSLEKPCRWGVFHFEITVPKPARPDRDEVLTLRIARGNNEVRRRLRFRIEQPLDFGFDWEKDPRGEVAGRGQLDLETRFPSYPFHGLSVQPSSVPEGWTVSVKPGAAKPMTFEVGVIPPDRRDQAGKVYLLKLEATAQGMPTQEVELPRLLFSGGRLYAAMERPRHVRAPPVISEVILDGRFEEAAWNTAARLEGFLAVGAVDFAQRQPRARIFKGADALYLAAELPAQEAVRARTLEPDKLDFADDLVEVYLESDGSPGFHCVFVNPNGVIADFAVRPQPEPGREVDLSWNSGAEARTQRLDKAWHLELRIPFASLPGGAPAAGSRWRFNVRAPHGIAPRTAEIFSFCKEWQPAAEEFAILEF